MDGGMSPTSTHSDLAGARRVLVISLTDGGAGSGRLQHSERHSTEIEKPREPRASIAANPAR
jgi:hypothetical protein